MSPFVHIFAKVPAMSKQLFSRDLRAGDILLQLPSVTAGLSHRLGYAA